MSSPAFTKHADGRITVDEFPLETLASEEFLRRAGVHVQKVGFREFRITCYNDTAIYRLVRKGKYPGSFDCRRMDW